MVKLPPPLKTHSRLDAVRHLAYCGGPGLPWAPKCLLTADVMAEAGLGYLVKHNNLLWLVTGYNGSWAWLERLNTDGQVQKHGLSEYTLGPKDVHDPSIAWGFLPINRQAPISAGGITQVSRNGIPLESLREWVPNPPSWDLPARGLYLSPRLKLQVGETLLVTFRSNLRVACKITKGFGTLAARRMAISTPETPTRWQLMEDL